MAIVPRIYSDEFKRDAVALVNSGLSQKQVCRDLGVSKTALQTWVKDDRFRALGFTPTTDVEERREMTAAMQRIRELEMENEVLRRAAAYLSRSSPRFMSALEVLSPVTVGFAASDMFASVAMSVLAEMA